MKIQSKLMVALVAAFLMSGVQAASMKDCRLHVMKMAPNAAHTALEYSEADNKKLKADVPKDLCLGKIKREACDKLEKKCAPAQKGAGLVGGYVQWGTSKEECPVCPGFKYQ